MNSRLTAKALACSLSLCAVAFVSVATPIVAYGQRSTSQAERVVDGKVVDKGDAPLPGAVVYLKDTKLLNVKTFICDEAGHFHFGHLSQNTDYELSAVSNGTKSNTKSISSFDDKNSYNFTLTVK